MKKILLLLIPIISIFAFTKVYAEGPFYFDWDTQSYSNRFPSYNYSYKDGYLMLDQLDNKYVLTIYDKDGELLVAQLFDYLFDDITIDGDNIYAYAYKQNTNGNFILLIDENLGVVKEISGNFIDYMIKDDKVVVYVHENDNTRKDYFYEKDLSTHIEKAHDDSIWYTDDFELAYDYLDNNYPYENSVHYLYGTAYRDNLMAYTFTMINNECGAILGGGVIDTLTKSPKPETKNVLAGYPVCTTPYVVLIDDQGNPKWEKELTDYIATAEVAFVENYIAVIALNQYSSDILILDMEGELVQTITSYNGFTKLTETSQGFAVNQGMCYDWAMYIPKEYLPSNSGPVIEDQVSNTIGTSNNVILLEQAADPFQEYLDSLPFPTYFSIGCSCGDVPFKSVKPTLESNELQLKTISCESNHQVYYLYRAITPKITEGEGNIEVASKGKPGEPVTFVVTPAKGYTLGVIKVTTADGEVLTFTENTFTMPSADVTIEATFILANENPKTADIAIAIVLMVALATGIIAFIERKRMKELS